MVKIVMATCFSFDGKNEEKDFIAAAGGLIPGKTIRLLRSTLCNVLSFFIDSKLLLIFHAGKNSQQGRLAIFPTLSTFGKKPTELLSG